MVDKTQTSKQLIQNLWYTIYKVSCPFNKYLPGWENSMRNAKENGVLIAFPVRAFL